MVCGNCRVDISSLQFGFPNYECSLISRVAWKCLLAIYQQIFHTVSLGLHWEACCIIDSVFCCLQDFVLCFLYCYRLELSRKQMTSTAELGGGQQWPGPCYYTATLIIWHVALAKVMGSGLLVCRIPCCDVVLCCYFTPWFLDPTKAGLSKLQSGA